MTYKVFCNLVHINIPTVHTTTATVPINSTVTNNLMINIKSIKNDLTTIHHLNINPMD